MPTDGWAPSPLSAEIEAPEDASITKGKVLKCKTLLKTEEDALLVRAVLQHRECMFPDQRTWRNRITEHWERGVEELTRIAAGEDDWVHIMAAVMDDGPDNNSSQGGVMSKRQASPRSVTGASGHPWRCRSIGMSCKASSSSTKSVMPVSAPSPFMARLVRITGSGQRSPRASMLTGRGASEGVSMPMVDGGADGARSPRSMEWR